MRTTALYWYNSYWYGGQYQDIQTAQGSSYVPVEMILPEPEARAISFPLVRTATQGQSVFIGYSIPGHSIWKRMPWGEAEMHFFSYTNDQVLHNQFSPYFLCRVSWLPIITNLGSLSQIRLNEYQLKSISFNYNICGIWKILNNTRQRKYGLNWSYNTCH